MSQFLEGFQRKIHECFNNLGYRKTLWIREELRESRFYLEVFLPHGTEKKRRRTLLCFTKSLVTKRLRIGEWGGDGGASRRSVERFCLTAPKNNVEDPFRAMFRKLSGSESLWVSLGEKCQSFASNNFCLTVPNLFISESFNVSLISQMEKFYA